MKFTVEGSKFRQAVKAVKPSGWKHEEALIIEARGKGVVEVTGWSPDLWIAMKVQSAEVVEQGKIVLHYASAAKAIAAMPGDEFEIEVGGVERLGTNTVSSGSFPALVIRSGDTAIKISEGPGIAPPAEPPYPSNPDEIQLHLGGLAEVVEFCSTDYGRPILNAVAVQDGGVYAATDSYRLAVVDLPEHPTREAEFLIPRGTILAASRLLPAKYVTAKVNTSSIMFEYADVRIYSALQQGQFPNWHALMPDKEKSTSGIEVDGIDEIVRRMAAVSRAVTGDDVPTTVSSEGGKVVFHAIDGGTGNEVTVRAEGKMQGTEHVSFNPQFLAAFIKGTNVGTMFGMDSLKPWGIYEDADYCFGATRTRILMPTRVR